MSSSSSSERAAKRQKLLSLVGLGNVSDTGLAAILNKMHPEQHNSEEGWAIRDACSQALRATYGPLLTTLKLPLEKGNEFDWEVGHPNRLMQFFANNCSAYKQLLIYALSRRPSAQKHDIQECGRLEHWLFAARGAEKQTPMGLR